MPRLGLEDLYIAKITNNTGNETYGTPEKVVPLVSASVTLNNSSYDFSAGDAVVCKGEEATDAQIDFTSDDIPIEMQAKMLGSVIDDNGMLLVSTQDVPPMFAVGFRSVGCDGGYIYVWYLRGKFGTPTVSYTTKGTSVTPQATSISYFAVPRNKVDSDGKKRLSIVGETGTTEETTLEEWFTAVPTITLPVTP